MAGEREVVVLSGVRTAVGRYGGSLADKPPAELAAAVIREAVGRAAVDPAAVGHVVFGSVIHTEQRDMYLSRVAGVGERPRAARSRPPAGLVRPRIAGPAVTAARRR